MKERLHDSKSIWLHFLMWWLKFEQTRSRDWSQTLQAHVQLSPSYSCTYNLPNLCMTSRDSNFQTYDPVEELAYSHCNSNVGFVNIFYFRQLLCSLEYVSVNFLLYCHLLQHIQLCIKYTSFSGQFYVISTQIQSLGRRKPHLRKYFLNLGLNARNFIIRN